METKLARIAEIAKTKPNEIFTSLAHLITKELLLECHYRMDPTKAAGVDGVTWVEYDRDVPSRLENLVERLKKKAYRPMPVRRTYIPKAGSNKMRPLGIPAYEDKLVQKAMVEILNPIYEQDFSNVSFGFRTGRGSLDALKVLNQLIEKGKTNYIVDADIKGFFDHVDHEHLMEFLKLRIADPSILRLIARFLKAGYMEAGTRYETGEGTPQGGIISPLLANIYLHYVLDLWFMQVVRKHLKGKCYLVRYADDFVCCFQHKEDAEKFYHVLIKRLEKYNLEIAEEKTKIIAFGKNAESQRQQEGKGKPDTFDFLGFTHYCGKSRHGKFRVKRITCAKKYRASLKRAKEWIKLNRTMPADKLVAHLNRKMQGYYHYYSITDNYHAVSRFRYQVINALFKWLNRRSQRKSFEREKFQLFLKKFPVATPKVYVNIYDIKPGLTIGLW